MALWEIPQRWLEREVAVLEFLAPSRLAVAPSPLISPGPHRHAGLWMTFSQWIADLDQGHPLVDAIRLGRALRNLHDELAAFDGELGNLSDLRHDIERLHGLLRTSEVLDPDTISSLRARLDAASDLAFGSALPVQALHGDASLSNLLHTPGRLARNDFEETFRGPVHWDVAGYVIALRRRGASPALVRHVLDSYGWGDEQELAPFIAAREVYDRLWRLYDSQRRPEPITATKA